MKNFAPKNPVLPKMFVLEKKKIIYQNFIFPLKLFYFLLLLSNNISANCDGEKGKFIVNPDGSSGGFVSESAHLWGPLGQPFKGHIGAHVQVCGKARVFGKAILTGNVKIQDNSWVYDNAHISDYAIISGQAKVFGNAQVKHRSKIAEHGMVFDNAQILQYAFIGGHGKVWQNAIVADFSQVLGAGDVSGNSKLVGRWNLQKIKTFFHLSQGALDPNEEYKIWSSSLESPIINKKYEDKYLLAQKGRSIANIEDLVIDETYLQDKNTIKKTNLNLYLNNFLNLKESYLKSYKSK